MNSLKRTAFPLYGYQNIVISLVIVKQMNRLDTTIQLSDDIATVDICGHFIDSVIINSVNYRWMASNIRSGHFKETRSVRKLVSLRKIHVKCKDILGVLYEQDDKTVLLRRRKYLRAYYLKGYHKLSCVNKGGLKRFCDEYYHNFR